MNDAQQWLENKYHKPLPRIQVWVGESCAVIQAVWGYMTLDDLKQIEEDLSNDEAVGIGIDDSYTMMIQVVGYDYGDPESGAWSYWMWDELWRVTYKEEMAWGATRNYLINFDDDIQGEFLQEIPF